MKRSAWIRACGASALSLSAIVALSLAGCGGQGQTDNAVVLPSDPLAQGGGTAAPAPASNTPAAPSSTTPAPAASTAPAAADNAPAAGGGGEGWGTIKGRVVFNGNPPESKTLDTSVKDPEVCAKTPAKSERLVVDPQTKGVKYALVYIPRPTKKNPEAESAAQQASVEFDQKNCIFKPHVLALMKGAKVVLKSSDPVNHNINAKLKVNNAYNTLLTANQEVTFQPTAAERGPDEVTCDIHPWMRAYWLIIDSPYFAVTDDQGNFEIKNVPAGAQKVVVWQEAVNYVTPASGDTVNVKANDTTTVPDFKIDPGKVRGE